MLHPPAHRRVIPQFGFSLWVFFSLSRLLVDVLMCVLGGRCPADYFRAEYCGLDAGDLLVRDQLLHLSHHEYQQPQE